MSPKPSSTWRRTSRLTSPARRSRWTAATRLARVGGGDPDGGPGHTLLEPLEVGCPAPRVELHNPRRSGGASPECAPPIHCRARSAADRGLLASGPDDPLRENYSTNIWELL